MNFKSRIAVALATGSLIASALLPATAFADTNVTVSGNGVGSHNNVTAGSNKSKPNSVKQTNVVLVGALVVTGSNTGNNKANKNTNGTVNVETGNSTSNSSVNVTGGSNSAPLPTSCGCTTNTTVNVTDNGAWSSNKVTVNGSGQGTKITQTNITGVLTAIVSVSNTGGNNANSNTGGSNSITTGDVTSTTSVNVSTSTNTITP